jgi:ribonuclease T2
VKPAHTSVLSFTLLAFTACAPSSGSTVTPVPQSSSLSTSSAMPAATAQGQPYDFYLLNLSWSPEYCVTNPGAVECSQHLKFVVHGLWPQNNDGTYPQHCGSRPRLSAADWQGLLPTAALAQHEWQTHGTCTPYDSGTYFGLIRKAFNQVRIPSEFAGNTQPVSEPPARIITGFADANPSFPSGSIALSCGNNALTAIEVCFDKSLNPTACQSVRTCRANIVKIPPA